ncbi:MAG: polysaccharide biosynthesis protein [Bacteroidia bacterium]
MKYLRILFTLSSNIPRWIIFLFDLGICAFAFVLAVILRYSFHLNDSTFTTIITVLPIVLMVKAIFMMYFRLYSGIIRHTSVQDGINVLYTTVFSSIGLFAISFFYKSFFISGYSIIPISIIILDFIIAAFFLGSFRIFVKLLYLKTAQQSNGLVINYVIFGAGEAGIITKRKLEQHRGSNIKVVAFFDDDSNMKGKSLEGIRIFDFDNELTSLNLKFEIDSLIISGINLSNNRKQEIVEKCLGLNINVQSVPPVEKWINGELSFNQIKTIKIEDLIQRDIIELDIEAIGKQLNGKVVMVTGAAGSIGSEIVNQLCKFKIKKIIIVDSSEESLYQLDVRISENIHDFNKKNIEIIVADITNMERMKGIFERFQPEMLYHAAAYKHVPLMESNPSEAIKTNVKGTMTLANLAVEYKVEKFVMVSTDKAVNPTNVMGASKRIAEIYVQSLSNFIKKNKTSDTKFITTRFGNVLGSSGSVIPRFKKQIDAGGPITVTHPEITRYFMTIPEACQLVLEAGYMGNGGEIYIFDMGKSVKIIDLAKKMIRLSGLSLGKDIQIIYTGLRPGEKIYEELLNDQENTIPTHHSKIMIGKVRDYNFENVKIDIQNLLELYNTQNQTAIVAKMKEIVPEFISQNSPYEHLDNKQELSEVTVEKLLGK